MNKSIERPFRRRPSLLHMKPRTERKSTVSKRRDTLWVIWNRQGQEHKYKVNIYNVR